MMYKPRKSKSDEIGVIGYFGKLDKEIDNVFGALKRRSDEEDEKDTEKEKDSKNDKEK